MNLPYEKYTSGDYLSQNPSWDSEDSLWKATSVIKILTAASLNPKSICEVGCGAGRILAELRQFYAQCELYGFDIAPDAARFWGDYENDYINFQLGDFFILNKRNYDVMLILDVVEHIPDPFSFLINLKGTAKLYLFHFPLDLSAINILRERPLLISRERVGHINLFTKELALKILEECGFKIIQWKYSGAGIKMPNRKFKTMLASLPRSLVYSINKDWGVRALGGETLFILAKD